MASFAKCVPSRARERIARPSLLMEITQWLTIVPISRAGGRARSSAAGDTRRGGRVRSAHRHRRQPAATLGGGDDRRLPVAPDRSAPALLGGTFDLAGHAGSPYAALRYTGAMRLSFDPALDRRGGDYLTADAGLAFGRRRLSIDVTNLFDGHADSFGFGNPFPLALADQHTPQRPQAISMRIGTRF
jgi:hypothetical protein